MIFFRQSEKMRLFASLLLLYALHTTRTYAENESTTASDVLLAAVDRKPTEENESDALFHVSKRQAVSIINCTVYLMLSFSIVNLMLVRSMTIISPCTQHNL